MAVTRRSQLRAHKNGYESIQKRPKVPGDYHNRILRNKIILLYEKKCILVTATERHELLHVSPSEEQADTKLILHAHEILKESSYPFSFWWYFYFTTYSRS